jgi:predicted secreted protein
MSNQWIPSTGEWVLVPKLFTPGETTIAQVTQRTRNSDGSQVWLWVDDRKFKLEHCQPATREHLEFEYSRLLELTATFGELLDKLEATE